MSLRTASHRTVLCKSTSLLYAVLSLLPATVQGAAWTFDSAYGGASVLALPGGQVTLVRDGAGQQARTIIYTPADNAAPIRIERSYGPGGRKAIENEDGVTRHHVYGTGLAPILRTESDGGVTYQVGLETISVPASGTATVTHRVLDLKESMVAVLDSQAQCGQRVSYTSYGSMQAESATVTPCSTTVLLGGYEGLTPWLLGMDQIVDNRARLYDPASARFLALDGAGQATAYEARANNPVSRVDVDGYVNFDRLLAAVQKDRTISIAIGANYGGTSAEDALHGFASALTKQKTTYRVFQQTGLLTVGLSMSQKLQPRLQDHPISKNALLVDRLSDLNPLPNIIDGEKEREFKEAASAILTNQDYAVFMVPLDAWNKNIPLALDPNGRLPSEMRLLVKRSPVSLIFVDANHLQELDHIYTGDGENQTFRFGDYIGESSPGVVLVSPASSFGLQLKYNLITIVPGSYADVVKENSHVLYTWEETPYGKFRVGIPLKLLSKNKTLADLYGEELLAHYMSKPMPAPAVNGNNGNPEEKGEEEKEEEKAEEEPLNRPFLRISVKSKDELFPRPNSSDK